MNTPATALPLSDTDRETLEGWVRRHTTAQQVALRAQVILYAAQGMPNAEIAARLNISRPTVLQWRKRFLQEGPDGLTRIQPGRGRKPRINSEKVAGIVEATLHSRPRAATHWSCRSMAQAQGVSPATVQRIWDAHGLQPHRVKTFKLSRDPLFVEKVRDIVGLYLAPPDRALVLCVDG